MTGESGAGLVKATATAKGELTALEIDPSIFDADAEGGGRGPDPGRDQGRAVPRTGAQPGRDAEADRGDGPAPGLQVAVLRRAHGRRHPRHRGADRDDGEAAGLGPRSARRAVLHLVRRRGQFMAPLAEAMRGVAETARECIDLRQRRDGRDLRHLRRSRSGRTARSAWSRTWPTSGRWNGLACSTAAITCWAGLLSALDAVGPEELGLPRLCRADRGRARPRMILALGATVDGQTTAHYIADLLEGRVKRDDPGAGRAGRRRAGLSRRRHHRSSVAGATRDLNPARSIRSGHDPKEAALGKAVTAVLGVNRIEVRKVIRIRQLRPAIRRLSLPDPADRRCSERRVPRLPEPDHLTRQPDAGQTGGNTDPTSARCRVRCGQWRQTGTIARRPPHARCRRHRRYPAAAGRRDDHFGLACRPQRRSAEPSHQTGSKRVIKTLEGQGRAPSGRDEPPAAAPLLRPTFSAPA